MFLAKTNQVHNNRLLQSSNVWRQNMSCLPPITTCFFLTCTHLDATDGNMVTNATNIFSLATKNSGLVTTLATRFLFDLDLK